MEWNSMELISCRKKNSTSRQQRGLTLLELMIAMAILLIGIIGSMALVVGAIAGDFASKQTSNATALAQTVTERIMAVPASTNATLTITDCTNTSYNVSTSAGGPAVTSGTLDFTQATVTGYYMPYTDCDSNGHQATYDVRWNIQTISTYTKLLTVAAQLKSAGKNPVVFAPVTTIRTIVGQGT
jgi:prepilin-type N-terminal cleavage/methylation domain-containing protein